jgi:hypothetical protein
MRRWAMWLLVGGLAVLGWVAFADRLPIVTRDPAGR